MPSQCAHCARDCPLDCTCRSSAALPFVVRARCWARARVLCADGVGVMRLPSPPGARRGQWRALTLDVCAMGRKHSGHVPLFCNNGMNYGFVYGHKVATSNPPRRIPRWRWRWPLRVHTTAAHVHVRSVRVQTAEPEG
eukprot:6440009-Prymnesium_polylepis.2